MEDTVAQLQESVKKLQNMVALTGRQVMEIRMNVQRQNIQQLDLRTKELQGSHQSGNGAAGPASGQDKDYVTGQDIVELVQELQGQLDILDERGIRRISNMRAGPSDAIAAVPSSNGEFPPQFPATLSQFASLPKEAVIALARFYELLPPDSAELEEMLGKVSLTPEQAGVQAAPAELSDDDVNNLFDQLARFCGVSARRVAGAW